MPEQEEGLLWGFQLWVNLPAVEKMKAPAYQEFKRDEIPEEARDDGVVLRVIAGTTSAGTAGPVQGIPTAPLYLDLTLPRGAGFEEPLPRNANAFVYVYEGGAEVVAEDGTAQDLPSGRLGLLGAGEGVRLRGGAQGGRLLLLAGRPLDEPVAWGGPIVMNTREEVLQAFDDMRAGRLA
jgi:redox-sensitive bicupin YhaK (pirin superfamily)